MGVSQEVQVFSLLRHRLDVQGVFRNFVRILARSRHLYCTTPVKVEIAKIIGEFLECIFINISIIICDKEMDG